MKFRLKMEEVLLCGPPHCLAREKMWQFTDNSQFYKSTIERRMQMGIADLSPYSFCLVIFLLSWRGGRLYKKEKLEYVMPNGEPQDLVREEKLIPSLSVLKEP